MLSKTRGRAASIRQIRISVKGLAKFMTSNAPGQRKALRDFNYPDPEGKAQAAYYRDARNAIIAFHKNQYQAHWLASRSAQLAVTAQSAVGRRATRLKHNARVLRAYERHFSSKQFIVLDSVPLRLVLSGVHVTISPDLHVLEKNTEQIIKIDFNVRESDPETIRIITQATFEAAQNSGLHLPSSCILYYSLASGRVIRTARSGSRTRAEIAAACQNIAAIWGSI